MWFTDSAGAGIARAQVSIAGMRAPVTTGDDGRFAISGRTWHSASHGPSSGFSSRRDRDRNCIARELSGSTSSLVPIARSLEPVNILARREPSDARLAGFNQRVARGTAAISSRAIRSTDGELATHRRAPPAAGRAGRDPARRAGSLGDARRRVVSAARVSRRISSDGGRRSIST